MDNMVFFNIAWMKEYKGVTPSDKPKHGGSFIPEKGWGGEVYNFQPYHETMYGFVEPGWEPTPCCIDIRKLGAKKWEPCACKVLIIWVARHADRAETVVVGWYENAMVYRERQRPPEDWGRTLPSGKQAPYFAKAHKDDCTLIPADKRHLAIPRGTGALGQSNVWYAKSERGAQVSTCVLDYINRWERCQESPKDSP